MGVFEYANRLEAELTRMGADPLSVGRTAFTRAAREWMRTGATVADAGEWIAYCKLTPEQAAPLIADGVTPMRWLAEQPD